MGAYIRQAELKDAEEILALMHDFNRFAGMCPIDQVKASTLVYRMLSDPLSSVFVSLADDSVVGFIAGAIVDDPLRDCNRLVEVGWYAYKGGLELLEAFINDGRRRCVDEIVMSTLSNTPKHVNRILERKGFAAQEVAYQLKLGD